MDEAPRTSRSRSRSAGKTSEHRHAARPDDVSPADLRHTVSEVLRILVLRRWVFFVPFCLATTAAFVASHYVPRTYEASTTFEQANDPVSVNLPPTLVTSTFGYFLSTLEEDIRSDEVMGPIVDELGLTGDLPRNPDGTLTEEGQTARAAIGKAQAVGVQVMAHQKSPFHNVIQLRYIGADPQGMTRLLSRMKEGYVRLVRRKVSDKLIDARNWYAARAEEKRAVLDEIDQKRTVMKMAHPGVDPANPESIAFELASLRSELAELQRTRARLSSQVAAREEFLAQARARVLGVAGEGEQKVLPLRPWAARIQEAIAASEARVTELKTTRGMTDRHPDIIAERKLQERYRRELLTAMEDGAGSQPADGLADPSGNLATAGLQGAWRPAYARVEMELAALIEQREQAAQSIQDVEGRVGEFVGLQGEVVDRRLETSRIREELDQARRDYETFRGLVGKCDHALTIENENRGIIFTDVVPAQGSTVPVAPLAKTVLLLSLLAGAATGTIFVVIAELFDRRFRTSGQVARALGVPILEHIDEIVTPTARRGRFLRRAVVVPAMTCVLLGMVGISGTLSYLSLSAPSTFERVLRFPKAAWGPTAGATDPVEPRSERTSEPQRV
ncbi:MAG: GumC domain-containing protein [Planctomycetota bacterium]